MQLEELPLNKELKDHLLDFKCENKGVSRLGNMMYRLEDRSGNRFYLKIGEGRGGADLRKEVERLDWVSDTLNTPSIELQYFDAGKSVVMLTELPGLPAHEAIHLSEMRDIIRVFARELRRIHELPIQECPFLGEVTDELERAVARCNSGSLDVINFRKQTGRTPLNAVNYLRSNVEKMKDLVFTHGDYCLPNLILDQNKASGILDWGLAGVADRNRDFMSAELTIKRNFGPEWIPLFYRELGLQPDKERVYFFWLLDRFEAHFDASKQRCKVGL